MYVENKKEGIFDWLRDFEVLEKRDNLGRYFCGYCIEPENYSTRGELYEKHQFERILSWVNMLNRNMVLAA